MRISDWSSDVCSSDLILVSLGGFGVRATRRSGGLFLLVNGLAKLHGDLRQRLGLALHFLDIIAFDSRFRSGNGGFNFGLQGGVDLVAMVGKLPFRGVDQAFRAIIRLCRFAALLLLFGAAFGIFHHLIDKIGIANWRELVF